MGWVAAISVFKSLHELERIISNIFCVMVNIFKKRFCVRINSDCWDSFNS